MSDGPVFVERIDYVAARDAMRRMDDLIMEGGPGAEGLGEIDVVMATVEAALVGIRPAEGSRVAGPNDLVIRREDIIEFTLTDNGIGVEDKDQVVVGCCYDEGPYWNLEAGRYLLIPLAAAEGGET